MEKMKVLIVDDHEMVRMGIRTYLETEPDIHVVGEASDGHKALQCVVEHQPDIVLMDLVMEEKDGIAATREIMKYNEQHKKQVRVIVLTSFVHDEKVIAAIESGATSYLLKTSRANEIIAAIRRAYRGEPTIESRAANAMMNRLKSSDKKHESLTNREREVLALIGKGKANKEIATELHIGIKTVKTHVSHILEKLEVEDRTQAAIYAVNEGLTDI